MQSKCKVCKSPATKRRGLISLCDSVLCSSTARAFESPAKPKVKKIKSRGMAGRPPNAFEKSWHDALASLGCIACHQEGINQPVVSIHHIDGRTKPNAHYFCLPLCAGHHQDGTGNNPSFIAVHPWKKRFEERYGTQMQLLDICHTLLVGKFDLEKLNENMQSGCKSGRDCQRS